MLFHAQQSRLNSKRGNITTLDANAGDVDAAAEMAQAQEEFSLAGGWDVDKAITEVLNGEGFSPEQVRFSEGVQC